VLTRLVDQISSLDVAVEKGVSIQAFLRQQIDPMVAKDATVQQAADAELAKFSDVDRDHDVATAFRDPAEKR
jgi:hypothetical protein